MHAYRHKYIPSTNQVLMPKALQSVSRPLP